MQLSDTTTVPTKPLLIPSGPALPPEAQTGTVLDNVQNSINDATNALRNALTPSTVTGDNSQKFLVLGGLVLLLALLIVKRSK